MSNFLFIYLVLDNCLWNENFSPLNVGTLQSTSVNKAYSDPESLLMRKQQISTGHYKRTKTKILC